MKKTIIITGIVVIVTIIGLVIFNKIVSQKDTAALFTEVSSGKFEITILTTGELIAENSVEIKGPAFSQGRDIHSTNIKITDLVPEGTEVNEGDFVAQLDRTELENNLKDARERLTSLQTQLEVLLLDTAIQMNSIRDQISNQKHVVAEAEITLRNSRYEPAPTIRDAEIDLDQAQRVLTQLERSYMLREAQTRVNVTNTQFWLRRIQKRISDYEEVLAGFTIYAPSSGMIIYKKNRLGRKRKMGSMIDAVDRVVATLPDLSSMISKVYISEIEISKVKIGQTANITVDAFPAKSYNGTVSYVANIGEKLPNTDTKVFEVQIKLNGSDFNLRPAMTTNNKIMIKTLDSVTYVPTECVHTGTDSIPFVYTKSGYRQAVVLGESNEKNVVIEKGLEPGMELYITVPDKQEKFKLTGEEIIKKGSI